MPRWPHQSLRERLLSKAVINWETGCWQWTAHRDRSGYGKITVSKASRLAHRIAYELIEGSIPEGLQLDHLCRNRACVNPAHLEPVTNWENQRRSPIAFMPINAAKTHCAAGHEFSPENTRATALGQRVCRTCSRAASARYKQRRRMALTSGEVT